MDARDLSQMPRRSARDSPLNGHEGGNRFVLKSCLQVIYLLVFVPSASEMGEIHTHTQHYTLDKKNRDTDAPLISIHRPRDLWANNKQEARQSLLFRANKGAFDHEAADPPTHPL